MDKRNDTRHIHIEMVVEDHKTLRLAAALRDQTMSAFAREAVVSAAGIVTRKLTPAAAVAAGTAIQRPGYDDIEKSRG